MSSTKTAVNTTENRKEARVKEGSQQNDERCSLVVLNCVSSLLAMIPCTPKLALRHATPKRYPRPTKISGVTEKVGAIGILLWPTVE
jgi:hypothetical protein